MRWWQRRCASGPLGPLDLIAREPIWWCGYQSWKTCHDTHFSIPSNFSNHVLQLDSYQDVCFPMKHLDPAPFLQGQALGLCTSPGDLRHPLDWLSPSIWTSCRPKSHSCALEPKTCGRGEGSMMVQKLGRNGYSRIGMSPANMMILILIILMSYDELDQFSQGGYSRLVFWTSLKTPIIEYGQIIQIAKIETVWNPSNSRGRHFQKPSWILGHQNAVWETCICPQVFLIPSVVGCCRNVAVQSSESPVFAASSGVEAASQASEWSAIS